MEPKKIGAFIAAQRKERQMTQKQLGEALGISDKTISKWECGNGLPDIAIMMPLCELLQINVNELLSGEHLTQDAYHRKAEENMMNLMQDYEKEKKGTARQVAAAAVWIAAMIAIIILPTKIMGMMDMNYFDLPSLIEVAVITVISLGFAGHLKNFGNAFRLLFREARSDQELKNAAAAVSLAEKAMLLGGAFVSMLSVLYLLFQEVMLTNPADFGANLGVAGITFFYGILGALLLAPVKGRLEKK